MPGLLLKAALLTAIWLAWWWAIAARLSSAVNLALIAGGALVVYPVAWVGRKILDRHTTPGAAEWTTTLVQCGLGLGLTISLIRALLTQREWGGWVLPIPKTMGVVLMWITGAACAATVLNLALKGLGAPFFIVLSRRVATDWLYARTRNPMALAVVAFLLSLGIWLQSALFVLWAVVLFAPALLFFIRVFEERELEIRLGAGYLEYKARTPMLIPAVHRTQRSVTR
ncbi:MAG TPA: methyltransferase [Acidobacteriaceae bacterium]|nr:methyltransferase [Acidobacteriaceae bacterium]